MPSWFEELLPILILLAIVAVVLVRLPKVREVRHAPAFKRRRVLNWLPLGLLYSFLYWGRYNLKVSQHVFEEMTNRAGDQLMTSTSFATIFGIGTAIYGVSFIINGPLTDRIGGRRAILIGGAGAALSNVLMALFTVMVRDQWAGSEAIGERFVTLFSAIYAANMYFQSFGAVAIVKVNAPWFHVRERGVFGAIFGILISLGLYFAYDWSEMIVTLFGTDPGRATAPGRLEWVFLAPAIALGVFWAIVFFVVKDSPGQAGLADFDTADASSGDTGPQLGARAVFRLMLRNPIVMTIAFVELCSGYLRQAVMQWGTTFAKHTDEALGFNDDFIFAHWGMSLCLAGILGGVVAGVISDHVFQSRRGPVASILYGALLAGTIVLSFTYRTPAVSWMTILLSMLVIGVHGMLSGTASMDFGGKKNVGVAVGIIDGFVYAGTALMSAVYGRIIPESTLTADHRIAGPTTDPANWWVWPAAMIPVALVGLLLAMRVWNAKPRGQAGGH